MLTHVGCHHISQVGCHCNPAYDVIEINNMYNPGILLYGDIVIGIVTLFV
jgi:hypothetical protein